MSEPRLGDYLQDIEQACHEAMGFVADHSFESFVLDRRTQQAVLMNFIIIGEASARITALYAEFTAAHPDVPWQQMRGMRNRMAHGYFNINLKIVWDTLQSAIPQLLIQIRELREAL